MINRGDFPKDDDGEVLFNLASKGIDLSKKRYLDFYCYVENNMVASELVDDLATYGYVSRIFIDEGGDLSRKFSVYARIFMRPDYEIIIAEQKRLDAILKFYGTYCDGWGTESFN